MSYVKVGKNRQPDRTTEGLLIPDGPSRLTSLQDFDGSLIGRRITMTQTNDETDKNLPSPA